MTHVKITTFETTDDSGIMVDYVLKIPQQSTREDYIYFGDKHIDEFFDSQKIFTRNELFDSEPNTGLTEFATEAEFVLTQMIRDKLNLNVIDEILKRGDRQMYWIGKFTGLMTNLQIIASICHEKIQQVPEENLLHFDEQLQKLIEKFSIDNEVKT